MNQLDVDKLVKRYSTVAALGMAAVLTVEDCEQRASEHGIAYICEDGRITRIEMEAE